MLCDIYFADGTPVPFSTRRILQRQPRSKLETDRLPTIRAGVELEFHVFDLDRPEDLIPATPGRTARAIRPEVSLLAHGFQYLTEQPHGRTRTGDDADPALQPRQHLDLPLRSMEVEFGPSQFEFTFHPGPGLATADAMVLFRSAVKQICRRNGLHASFMCRPALENIFSSGWHLHQSLVARDTGRNAFMPEAQGDVLSQMGLHFAAGLMKHARAGSVFAAPTINGYKRYRPHSLAPDRIVWGRDNKGAMIRAIGGPDDPASRIENRAGEPAANPYLCMAAQILAGLDGIENTLDPGAPCDEPYAAEAPRLPQSLIEALNALRTDTFFRSELGDAFVDYLLTLKDAEVDRFLSSVTDWEHREYFDIY